MRRAVFDASACVDCRSGKPCSGVGAGSRHGDLADPGGYSAGVGTDAGAIPNGVARTSYFTCYAGINAWIQPDICYTCPSNICICPSAARRTGLEADRDTGQWLRAT